MSQKIRLRYTGLTLYASRGFSVLASFAYVLTVTRTLSAFDFGVAQNIGDVIPYLTLLASAIPGWAQRYIARGLKGVARAALLVNLALGIPFTIACILLAQVFAKVVGTISLYYIIAAFQVIELYLMAVLENIAYGKKPHVTGYVAVVHDFTRVILAVILVVILKTGLFGVLLSVVLTYIVDLLAYAVTLREELLEKPNYGYIREWGKTSFLSFYGMLASRVSSFDMILLILFAGTVARAYYGAAAAISAFLAYSSVLSTGLYPRLLSGGGSQDVNESLKITFMFSIPMAIGTLMLAPSFLTILNPTYVAATPILYVMAFGSLYMSISSVLSSIIGGTENVDNQRNFTFADLIKSRLFLLPTFTYIYALIDLPVLYYVLISVEATPEMAGLYCAMIGLTVNAAILALMYRSAKKCMEFKIPLKTIATCMISSLVMAILVWVLPTPTRISTMLTTVGVGCAAYFGVLTTLDKDARALVAAVIRELRSRFWKQKETDIDHTR